MVYKQEITEQVIKEKIKPSETVLAYLVILPKISILLDINKHILLVTGETGFRIFEDLSDSKAY